MRWWWRISIRKAAFYLPCLWWFSFWLSFFLIFRLMVFFGSSLMCRLFCRVKKIVLYIYIYIVWFTLDSDVVGSLYFFSCENIVVEVVVSWRKFGRWVCPQTSLHYYLPIVLLLSCCYMYYFVRDRHLLSKFTFPLSPVTPI